MEDTATQNAVVTYLPPLLENIPAELKAIPQWVAWKPVPAPKKPRKVPMNPKTEWGASTTNPGAWATFDDAVWFYIANQGKEHTHRSKENDETGPIAGVGFVLTAADPYVGIDLDHCVAEDGNVEPWAREIIAAAGSYTELSPSGTGVRIFVKGKMPSGDCKTGDVEMYCDKRYLTTTGIPVPGFESAVSLPIAENQEGIDSVHACYVAKPAKQDTPPSTSATSLPSVDDDTLLAKIRASGQGAKFEKLMRGDISEYTNKGKSQSEADMALCSMLAFWARKNAEQMDRLFRTSLLYRTKWDEMHGAQTYGAMTIAKAIAGTKDVYGVNPQAPQTEEQEHTHGFLPPPPPVPLDAFPDEIAALLREAADAFGVSPEIPVASFLAFLSGLVGRSRLISIKEGWVEAGNLWFVTVAKSGTGKSPCISAFFATIYNRERNSKKD